MKRIVIAALLALIATPAFAHKIPCGEPNKVLKMHKDRFGEEPRGMGIVGGGKSAGTLLIGPNGNWSFLVYQDGKLCLMSTGRDWQGQDASPKGEPV